MRERGHPLSLLGLLTAALIMLAPGAMAVLWPVPVAAEGGESSCTASPTVGCCACGTSGDPPVPWCMSGAFIGVANCSTTPTFTCPTDVICIVD
jgi:hypothetical protein